MSVIYNKTKAGGICIEVLEFELASAASITAILELIIVNDDFFIDITFDRHLTAAEEGTLNDIIEDHDCVADDTSSENDDVATMQMATKADQDVPVNWKNLVFNDIAIMNDPSIISTGDEMSDFVARQAGLYHLHFCGEADMKHGITRMKLTLERGGLVMDIPYSETSKFSDNQLSLEPWGYGTQRATFGLSINIDTILEPNDIIRVQFRKEMQRPTATYRNNAYPTTDSGVYARILRNSSFVVTRMNGPQGPQGNPGKDATSTLEIQKYGATKAVSVDKLNFTGDVTVVDNGNNKATVNIVGSSSGLTIHQLKGADGEISEPMAFLVDTTRKEKLLSIDTTRLGYAENTLSHRDWCQIGTASDTDSAHMMPYDGVVVRITAMCENTNKQEYDGKHIAIYVNDEEVSIPITFTGTGYQSEFCTNINVSFRAGDRIRIRAVGKGNTIYDTVIDLYVKWETK